MTSIRLTVADGASATDRIALVTNTPGLVACWTFGEDAGMPRVSVGTPEKHPLR